MRLMGGAAGALTSSLIGAGGLSFAFIRMGRSANQFAGAMNRSIAIMKDVNADIRKDMERTAIAVARDTKFGATEAAEAYFFLASAGLDAAQSIAALPGVAKFAQAGNFDLSLATDLATDALSALGLKSADAAINARNLTRVMDVLVEANRNANASVEQFSQALTNKAGAAMRILGIEIEEGLAVLSVWADQGLKAQDAGTRMDIVLRDLTAKAILNADAFEKAGIAVFEFGEIRNIADIVQDMERRMLGMTDRGRKAELMLLGFTNKTVNATASLLGFSSEIRNYEAQLKNAGGATEDVSDNLTDLDSSWAKAGAAMQTISNQFMPPILDSFAALITQIAGTTDELQKGTEAMGNWAKAGQKLADVGEVAATSVRFVGAVAGLASESGGRDPDDPNKAVEQARFANKVFGLPQLQFPLERGERRTAQSKRELEAIRNEPRGFSAEEAAGGLLRLLNVGKFAEEFAKSTQVPRQAEDFTAMAREVEGRGGDFDFMAAAEQLNELRETASELVRVPAADALARALGLPAVTTAAGAGAEVAPGLAQNQRELFDAQFDAFVKAHESAMSDAAKAGAAIFAATRTPTERFKKNIEDINQLLSLNMIDATTAARARAAERETLRLSQEQPEEQERFQGPRFAGAMLRGSAEAFSTIVQAGARDKIPREQLKTVKEQLAVQKDIARKLGRQETVSIPAT